MDGDRGPQGEPAITTAPPSPSALRAKVLRCPTCGNSLTLRGMERTESIACDACGSVIDPQDENLRVISTFQSKLKYEPAIPLGSQGKMKGDLFEVIGFMRRAMTVEGVIYEWSEYLLFNPYKGYRWLSEYHGHWSFLRTTTHIPKTRRGGTRPSVQYLDQTFLHFQTYEARVVYVRGEFYWKVQAGESCRVSDYISPPLILSREQSEQEITWTIGEYVEPEALRNSFHLTAALPPRIGVAPNQPYPYRAQSYSVWILFGYFFLAAVLIHLAILLLSQNKLVYENRFVYRQSDPGKALVTDIFEIPGHTSNVVIRSATDVNNNWIYLHFALIDEEGRAYDFGREVSYYHSVDGGERWSEGATHDEAILPAVPPGKYYLRIEPESSFPVVNYSIQVYRDVPQWSYLFIALAALCLLPVVVKWRSSRFEAARWSESDQ
jgi:hypothetical protein